MRTFLTMAVLAAALGGCVAHREYVVEDGDVEEVAVGQPPAPQVEVIPAAPRPNMVWVGGRWAWSGGRYVWRGGRYVVVRPGRTYVAGRWERHPRGWVYVRAHWR